MSPSLPYPPVHLWEKGIVPREIFLVAGQKASYPDQDGVQVPNPAFESTYGHPQIIAFIERIIHLNGQTAPVFTEDRTGKRVQQFRVLGPDVAQAWNLANTTLLAARGDAKKVATAWGHFVNYANGIATVLSRRSVTGKLPDTVISRLLSFMNQMGRELDPRAQGGGGIGLPWEAVILTLSADFHRGFASGKKLVKPSAAWATLYSDSGGRLEAGICLAAHSLFTNLNAEYPSTLRPALEQALANLPAVTRKRVAPGQEAKEQERYEAALRGQEGLRRALNDAIAAHGGVSGDDEPIDLASWFTAS